MAGTSRTKRKDRGKKALLREVKRADGLTVKAGIFPGSGRSESVGDISDDGETTFAEIGTIHEFGAKKANIDRRPWLSQSVKKNRTRWRVFLRRQVKDVHKGKVRVRVIFTQLGIDMEGSIKRIFTEGNFKGLKASTVARKGSSRPLIDTGNLRNSIGWEVIGGK